jgi:hypothetical protein
MPNLIEGFLEGATVEVEVAGLPPISVSLNPNDPPGPLSPLIKSLRPSVTIKRGGETVYSLQPYGSPSEGFPTGLVMASIWILVILYLVFGRK